MEGNGRSNTNLALATVGFALCFAVWGLIAPLAPRFQQALGLTDFLTGVLIAVPVLLGSVARIPMGMLTDRYGGRVVFTALIAFSIVPVVVAGASLVVKLHMITNFVFVAYFPFTKLVHAFSFPVAYFARPYIAMRSYAGLKR